MSVKLKIAPTFDTPYECPFYRQDETGSSHCLFKLITSIHAAVAVVEDNPAYDPDYVNTDCLGTWERCAYLPLLYKIYDEPTAVQNPVVPPELPAVNSDIADFNPFGLSDEVEERGTRLDAVKLVVPEQKSQIILAPAIEAQAASSEDQTLLLEHGNAPKIWVTLAKNMYTEKADVLVYPTNGTLDIDDTRLLDLVGGSVRTECQRFKRPIQMGHIYATSSGGELGASCIYHAVVASPMRVVNMVDVGSCMRQSLARADARGAKSIIFIPADMGSADISHMAMTQLSALYRAIGAMALKSLRDIYVVMEPDDVSDPKQRTTTYDVYRQYLMRIFQNYTITQATDRGLACVVAEIRK
jgi:hypothetical protein